MKKVLVIVSVMALATAVWATAPYPGHDYVLPYDYYVPMYDTSINPLLMRFNYLYEFRQIADFCAAWQLDDIDSADHGGMIEAESGELWNVIQTDNTQEAIWVWSRYGELTGDTARYRDNIEKAWFYCENFPAWLEENDYGEYYRAHNCAWGIAAEERYREVYADDGWTWYRDSCAEFMKVMPSDLGAGGKINRFVTGWCAGWLYHHGVKMGDEAAKDSACSFSEKLLVDMEGAEEFRLKDEAWAMSAGTIVWGICNSVFKEDPTRGAEWVAANGQYLDTFQTWISSGRSWDNSWNVGFCNGHGAMYDISGNETYARHHRWLTHKLLSYDTDNDGGIPASTHEADTIDMSWVSTYLCMMGLDRLIGEVPQKDAGVLELVGLYDCAQIEAGSQIDLRAVVSNFGLDALNGISVVIEGDASGAGTADLEFLEADTVLLVEDWSVPDSALLVVTINHPADEDEANNTLTVRLNKAGITEVVPVSIAGLDIRYLNGGDIGISYSLKNADRGKLAVYSADGRKVKGFDLETWEGTLVWDKRDKEGIQVSKGVYFIKLTGTGVAVSKKIAILH
ncbi:T9SS type A sorting domain-containing protein [candidate division WOR-3 bacterium]|nr:T9SS type A sorting domain-containing protein [candidate division WOR-3 bacterium]